MNLGPDDEATTIYVRRVDARDLAATHGAGGRAAIVIGPSLEAGRGGVSQALPVGDLRVGQRATLPLVCVLSAAIGLLAWHLEASADARPLPAIQGVAR